MINKSKKINILGLVLIALGFVVISGSVQEIHAQQRDPFAQPAWKNPKPVNTTPNPNPNAPAKVKDGKPVEKIKIAPGPVGIPAIQDRINYFKRIREQAAANNQPLPKVTSVLTIDEMSVMGIVRTPRGFAAMVQATPINLSYTVYPGEKFFNGQLVAIEENRLVFRKVVKMSDGKFIASEENKTLRQYTPQEEIQGTAPSESGKTETAKTTDTTVQPPATQTSPDTKTAPVTAIVSPLDEMNKPVETPKTAKDKKGKVNTSSNKKGSKKPEKVAENKDQ